MQVRTVFVGNCQASALCAAYNLFLTKDSSEQAQAIDGRRISSADERLLRSAETVVVQVTDFGNDSSLNYAPGIRVIKFPYVTGAFLWPYATEGHIRYFQSPMHIHGAYGDEFGDALLNRFIREGVPVDEAVGMYLSRDVVRVCNLPRRFELFLKQQAIRDARSGIEIAPYIRERLEREQLFLTRGHLGAGLFRYLAEQVLRSVVGKPITLDRLENYTFFPEHELPIHPAISAHLELPYGDSNFRFRVNFARQTFAEFAARYMESDFNLAIYEAVRLLEAGDFQTAIPVLSEVVNTSVSPEAWAALGAAYSRSGNNNKAKEALFNASNIEPNSTRWMSGFRRFFPKGFLPSIDLPRCS